MLIQRFQSAYRPGQCIVVDESLMLFKGRLSWKQFIRTKRARFGVKNFELCDSETGYLFNLKIYCGKIDVKKNSSCFGKSGDVVIELCEKLLNQGRTISLDNWYTSPLLFEKLHREGTNACGTVRLSRKHMPQDREITQLKKLKKGEMLVRHNKTVAFCAWKDKRVVTMLSTSDVPTLVSTNKTDYTTGQKIVKPNIVIKYNSNMEGVDQLDQSTQYYPSTRKSVKWYKKYFFSLVDKCIYNSLVIYRTFQDKEITVLEFREKIITGLLHKHWVPLDKRFPRRSRIETPLRLNSRCFPSIIPVTGKKCVPMKRCVVCRKKDVRKETRYYCNFCNAALCVAPCFMIYHTEENF